MSDLPPGAPFSLSNPSSSKLNQSHQISTQGLPELSQSISPEPQTLMNWQNFQYASPSGSFVAGNLPVKKVFSTNTGKLSGHQNSVQLAQAALALDSEVTNTDGFNGSVTMSEDSLYAIDPNLLAMSLDEPDEQSNNQSALDPVAIQHDALGAGSSVQSQEHIFQPSFLPPQKRKDMGLSPAKQHLHQSKRNRTDKGIAEQLQTPLPPGHTILANRQIVNVGTPSGAQRASLSSSSNAGEISSLPPPQNFHDENAWLRQQNRYLEVQLSNRNFESARQGEEIHRANEYAAKAKVCMRKDGEDVNSLKALLIATKKKVEIWRQLLQPMAVKESFPTREDDNDTQEGQPLMPATWIVSDCDSILANLNKAIAEVHDRPVHELDDVVDTRPRFNHDSDGFH